MANHNHALVREIATRAARRHGAGLQETLVRKSRARQAVNARADTARQLRARGWSYARIGRALGGYHPSSVGHLLKLKRSELIPLPDVSPIGPDEDLPAEEDAFWAI
jgi:hypothetical protein